jgi:hypothetical protein
MKMTVEKTDEQMNHIRANAALVITELGPLSDVAEFGVNRASLAWVEGYIERQRARTDHDAAAVSNLVGVFGSFLGECLIAATEGAWHWSETEQAWSVSFPNDTHAFPFVKVRKLFTNGLAGGDSIVSFYDTAVEHLATGKLTGNPARAQSAPPN